MSKQRRELSMEESQRGAPLGISEDIEPQISAHIGNKTAERTKPRNQPKKETHTMSTTGSIHNELPHAPKMNDVAHEPPTQAEADAVKRMREERRELDDLYRRHNDTNHGVQYLVSRAEFNSRLKTQALKCGGLFLLNCAAVAAVNGIGAWLFGSKVPAATPVDVLPAGVPVIRK